MTKPDTSKLQGPLKEAIDAELGGYDAFVESFSAAAATRFGSGWAWLVVNQEGNLEVTSSANQDNPLLEGKKSNSLLRRLGTCILLALPKPSPRLYQGILPRY